MSTDAIKNFLSPNIINILTYFLLSKERSITFHKRHLTGLIEKDIENNRNLLSGIIERYKATSGSLQIGVTNRTELELFLKNYINAYKEECLISIDADVYPYIPNLFKMYELLEKSLKDDGGRLSSFKIAEEESPKIRFAEIVLDLYFNEKAFAEIQDCTLTFPRPIPLYVSLDVSISLNKTPLEIYKSLLFDFYLNQSLSKSNNKFFGNVEDEAQQKTILKIFEAYANGKESREVIGSEIGISEVTIKKIEEKLKTFHHLSTHKQLIMKAVQDNIVRLDSTF